MYRLLPNLATCGNLIAGFSALLLAAQGDFRRAAVLVALAAGFDLLDGAFSRREPEPSAEDEVFGTNLDSLADLLSFGAAPAFALYLSTLHAIPVGIAACLLFLLCGAFRLARFPLVKGEDRFVGLPIPPAGLLAALIAAVGPPAWLALAVTVALGALMVSTLPFPTPSALRRSLRKQLSRERRSSPGGL
ncbi:MAG: CDP-diacylglycerol--serine O-phosphatidyltransferase [Actinomycetota bacterium]